MRTYHLYVYIQPSIFRRAPSFFQGCRWVGCTDCCCRLKLISYCILKIYCGLIGSWCRQDGILQYLDYNQYEVCLTNSRVLDSNGFPHQTNGPNFEPRPIWREVFTDMTQGSSQGANINKGFPWTSKKGGKSKPLHPLLQKSIRPSHPNSNTMENAIPKSAPRYCMSVRMLNMKPTNNHFQSEYLLFLFHCIIFPTAKLLRGQTTANYQSWLDIAMMDFLT